MGFFMHVMLLAAAAVYCASAGPCYHGRPACHLSCLAQNCATGYCVGSSSVCRCSRCDEAFKPLSVHKRKAEDLPEPTSTEDTGYDAIQPRHPEVGKTLSILQGVDTERLAVFLNDEDIQRRFQLLGFDIITIHETILEGWGSNRNRSSDGFGILRKYISTKEEGLQLLTEIADIFSDLLDQETKESLEEFLLSQEPPHSDKGRSKRYEFGLGRGWYFDISSSPSIGWRNNRWNVNFQSSFAYSFRRPYIRWTGAQLSFTYRW